MTAPKMFRVVNGGGPDDPLSDENLFKPWAPQDSTAEAERTGEKDTPPGADEEVRSSWAPVDLAPVLRGDAPQVVPVMFTRTDGAHLIYPGKLHTFMGESESCKSWAALMVCAERIKRGETAMWIDLEDDAETATSRLLALGVTADEILARFIYIRPDSKLGDLTIAALTGLVVDRGVTFVVVDSMNEFMSVQGLDPWRDIDVVVAHATLRYVFTRHGTAVDLLDHVVKDKDSRGRWASGSERKISGLDGAAYVFEVVAPFAPGLTGQVRVTVSKDRPGRVRAVAGGAKRNKIGLLELVSDPDGGVRISLSPESEGTTAGTFRPTGVMAKISALLLTSPGGLSKNAVRLAVGGKHDYADLALDLLVSERYVNAAAAPRNGTIYSHLRTFSEVPK